MLFQVLSESNAAEKELENFAVSVLASEKKYPM